MPTARGWQALALGLLVLIVARLIGTTQFHQLAYAFLALPAASLVLGLLSSRGLGLSRSFPPGVRVTAGSPTRVDLRLSIGWRFGTSKVSVMDHLPEPRKFEVPPLRESGGTKIGVPLTFARRGVYELGPAEVRVVDPFGLLRFVRRFEERTEVVVYPRLYSLPGFPLRDGNLEDGARGSVGRRGDEFAGLREYRRGDDRRHIHWKSLARTGELYVKEFALHAPHRYTVALDLRREGIRAQENEVEDAVSCAASVLTHLWRGHLPFRLLSTDKDSAETEFGSDEASYWRAMRTLATVRADGGRRLGEAVLQEQGRLGEGVVLISRTREEGLPACVHKLRGAGLSVVVVALATHTYRTPPGTGGASQSRESEFVQTVDRLGKAGATVLILSHPVGVAGLSGASMRERGVVS
jgi:uncharacterized protein (DUF58 family)